MIAPPELRSDRKFIDIQDVEQTFKTPKGSFLALRDIHLTVAQGEFVALIGHSGCGKSTLLNLVAGLLKASAAGQVPAGATIVCTVTGHGLKDPQWALKNADGSDIAPVSVPAEAYAIARELGLHLES